jgi:hypothetical protein
MAAGGYHTISFWRVKAELCRDVTLVDFDLGGESGLDLAHQRHAPPAFHP